MSTHTYPIKKSSYDLNGALKGTPLKYNSYEVTDDVINKIMGSNRRQEIQANFNIIISCIFHGVRPPNRFPKINHGNLYKVKIDIPANEWLYYEITHHPVFLDIQA